MVASFPLALASLADLLGIRSVTWTPRYQQEFSGLGSGEILTADLGPMLWDARIETAPMTIAAAEQMRARFELLDGATRSFLLFNPLMKYPQADPTGSILGASTVTITAIGADRNTVTLGGLPAGYDITIGDMFSVIHSTSRYALIRFAETMSADGTGALGPIEVRPYLRSGITTTLEVTLKKPVAKVKLLPEPPSVEMISTKHAVLSFSARQTLEA